MHCFDLAMVGWDSFVTSCPTHFECHKACLPKAKAITCGKTVKSISSCSYVMCLSGGTRVRENKRSQECQKERGWGRRVSNSNLKHIAVQLDDKDKSI